MKLKKWETVFLPAFIEENIDFFKRGEGMLCNYQYKALGIKS